MTAQKEINKSANDAASHSSDFSIEHILNRAGNSCSSSDTNLIVSESSTSASLSLDAYTWLNCTRYCPPKIPLLEEKFQQSPYLSSEEVILLARRLQLADIRVKIWFQNRRARERREKMHHINRAGSEVVQSSTTPSSPRSSPVPQVLNFLPAQALLQSHLTECLLPVNHQI
ncbi:homeobox protein ceh-1 [Zophobas morio]|uniref:homeobox protein ceh-1 n=1 Tax=Zophobas morio TaxID=2755281 RepID=UPI003083CD19